MLFQMFPALRRGKSSNASFSHFPNSIKGEAAAAQRFVAKAAPALLSCPDG